MLPFNHPYVTGKEVGYIQQAIDDMHLSGDGGFTAKCDSWLEQSIGCRKALLTPSCTAALEMTALLMRLEPGDEVIMPSFTFVSTANAFVLRGGVPVFIDIRSDTLCIDETKIEAAITPRTKAIVVVHYAGVACDMDPILALAERYGLLVIEDAAQAVMAFYKDRPLGSMGSLAALSFHETKNVICGEGGALLMNDPCWLDRAEVIRDKGTNRRRFFRGEVDKYSWVDLGSSYLPSEIAAAFLWAQLEQAKEITQRRLEIWYQYHEGFAGLEAEGHLRRPGVPAECRHNGHMYYLILSDLDERTRVLGALARQSIHAVFHYVPLHSSPAGRKYGRAHGKMVETDSAAERLVRLPLWAGMTDLDVERVIITVAGSVKP